MHVPLYMQNNQKHFCISVLQKGILVVTVNKTVLIGYYTRFLSRANNRRQKSTFPLGSQHPFGGPVLICMSGRLFRPDIAVFFYPGLPKRGQKSTLPKVSNTRLAAMFLSEGRDGFFIKRSFDFKDIMLLKPLNEI